MVAISEISKNGSKAALQNRVAQLPRSQSRRRSIFFPPCCNYSACVESDIFRQPMMTDMPPPRNADKAALEIVKSNCYSRPISLIDI